jgi:hypothetical protein
MNYLQVLKQKKRASTIKHKHQFDGSLVSAILMEIIYGRNGRREQGDGATLDNHQVMCIQYHEADVFLIQ